jgi:hypothetical protein
MKQECLTTKLQSLMVLLRSVSILLLFKQIVEYKSVVTNNNIQKQGPIVNRDQWEGWKYLYEWILKASNRFRLCLWNPVQENNFFTLICYLLHLKLVIQTAVSPQPKIMCLVSSS